MSEVIIANRDEIKAVERMPVGIQFMAHTILAVRNKIRESDIEKDFRDWTVQDVENSLEHLKGSKL